MRRQARILVGGALMVRSASALQVWLWLLIFIFQNEFRISRSIQPGYLDFDNLPETNFTCTGKVIGGYYADLETSCQMFHVCTVGQQDEPMDIKFLCLNGTVFDQETRVCERVDEVDCTKSEKFYSLNLELYGNTVPPTIEVDQQKPEATEQSQQHTKPNHDQETDPTIEDSSTSAQDKNQEHQQDVPDSTEDPVQDIKKDEPQKSHTTSSARPPLQSPDNKDLTEEYEEEVEFDGEYEDYAHPTTTSTQVPTTISMSTTTMKTTTTTTKPPPTTTAIPSSSHQPSTYQPIPHLISSPSPILSSLSPPIPSSFSPSASGPSSSFSSAPSGSAQPTLDPSLLSPQEFIYRHRGPGSEAISFQRQSFRPADGIFITHAPPQQFDHFQYESSRTAPRPSANRPAPFVHQPQPAPFRPTTLDPRDQLLRPGPNIQSSERHEIPANHRTQNYPTSLPAQRPLDFNPYYYDRKRSDDSRPVSESALSARSVAPPNVTERPPIKLKSPPRVIVTASASVSDSNGKRLNYTVGNVVSAVKPIVPINYDDYKESDLIFDPFFLDVPKLQKRRKTRSNRNRSIFTVPATATITTNLASDETHITLPPATSRATTTEKTSTLSTVTTTTSVWNPNDYVDDNYEPHSYVVPPAPPLAILVPHDLSQVQQERQSTTEVVDERIHKDTKLKLEVEEVKPTSSSAAQTTSSQSVGGGTLPVRSPSAQLPLEAPASAHSRSVDCRTRA